jgi:hypothetical protein
MAKRIIPNLYIAIKDGTDFDLVQENEQIQSILFNSIISGIEDAIKTNKEEATIIELNSSGNYISLDKDNWKPSLEKAQVYFTSLEEYEKCADIQKLIESISSYGRKRIYRKATGSDKSNNRGKKYTKAS